MRYHTLDNIRGLTLISMITYHVVWDLVYLFGVQMMWYRTVGAYIWQQSICWTFILLSGFCWSMGKRKWMRGLEVFAGGLLITVVTLVVMPQERVVFGVLTCLGSSMLLLTCVEPVLKRVSALVGLVVSSGCFFLLKDVNDGYLGFEGIRVAALPKGLYQNWLTAYLGFPQRGFYSTDYFSMIPWFFLFLCGYFLYRLLKERGRLECLKGKRVGWLEWMGKHSLVLYLLHQPAAYLVLTIWFSFVQK